MILSALLVLAQALTPEDTRWLSGPVLACSGEINPSLGAYTLTLYMPNAEQHWHWTYMEEPFLGMVNVNKCRSGCKEKWVITRVAPYSSVNYVPDGYTVAFTCESCYHAFFLQRGKQVDFCRPKEGP